MNCETFEMLMVDALGDELAASDRPAFEAHLAECERCRSEYEASRRAVGLMVSLPGPEHMTVERQGDRLVIQRAGLAPAFASRRFGAALLRYAATILVAFVAGYGWHAGSTTGVGGAAEPPGRVHTDENADDHFQQRLATIYSRGTARSDLAKCLMAMAVDRR